MNNAAHTPFRPVYNIHHNYNLVPHEQYKLDENEQDEPEDGEDGQNDLTPPLLQQLDESSEDESYVDSEGSDEELDEDAYLEEEEALEDRPACTRSGRETRIPDRYNDFTMLSALNPEETLIAQEDELGYLGVVMLQMSLKEGLKILGEKGEKSALKEMTQLHDMDTFTPRDPRTLTREERVKALSSLIFLKEKSNGDVKSRTCINGAPQRAYIRKENAASPTVMTDSVFITGAISAHEKRVNAACDLPKNSLKRSRRVVLAHTTKISSRCVTRQRPDFFRRSKLSDSIIQWRNWSSCKNEQVATSKLQLPSFPPESRDLTKTTGEK